MTCVVLWAFIPVVAKIGQSNLDNYQFLFYSSLFSLLVLFVVSAFSKKLQYFSKYNSADFIKIAGLSFLGAFLYYLLLYYGYSNAKGLEVLVLQYSWVVLIVVFSFFILKERLTFRLILSVILGFSGALIVITKGNFQQIHLSNISADLIVLLAASAFALFSVLSKRMKYEPLSMTTYLFACATAFSFAALAIFSEFKLPDSQSLLPLIINGAFINGLSYVIWLKALRYEKASFVAPFVFLTPLLAALLIVFFFREEFLWVYLFGLIAIVVSGLLNSSSVQEDKSAAK